MECRCKAGAIVALIILAPLGFSQVRRVDVRPNEVKRPPVDSGRALDPEKIRQAEALFNGAKLASERGDLKGAHSLLEGSLRILTTFEPPRRRNGEKITLTQTDLDRYHDTLHRASELYLFVTPKVEQILQTGDTSGAEALNREFLEAAPAIKDEYIREAETSYRAGDWTKAAATCDEVEKQPYFALTSADRERIRLLRSRSQNRLQATALPADTVIVDRLTAASYFHVFGSGGAVDILIQAGSAQELLAHPEFALAKDRIARGGDDLVLTPSVTKVQGWRDAFQHEFRDSVIWSDPYIAEASQALAAMRAATLKPADFDLAILLPKNAKQQAAMGLQWTDAQRDYAWNAAEYFKSVARDAPVITEAANRSGIWGWATDAFGTESKKEVMRSLTSKKGMVILFAHGDRDGVYTPEGEKLTVQDVRGLNLHENQPIVLLLSCEGNAAAGSSASSSIAQELKRSGAMAVMSYEQKVDAREAASAGVQFFENMRSGKTPLESFRLTVRSKGVRAGPKLHLKVQLQRLVPADLDARLTGRVSA